MIQRTLMMVTRYGSAKDYVLPAFARMLDACVVDTPGLDIIWAGDRPGDQIRIPPGFSNCADICRIARVSAMERAEQEGYDRIVFQGLDALYQSRADFERLLSHDLPIVGALISARTDSTHACARRFVWTNAPPPIDRSRTMTKCQDDVPDAELLAAATTGELVWCNWPGWDNIVISSALFALNDVMATCPEWYMQDGDLALGNSRDSNSACGNLDHTEWFCWHAAREGVRAGLDTGVKVWHVHESGAPDGGPLARMYPGIEVPLDWLTWA